MTNTAQITFQINIDANNKLVTIIGKTIIDGKQILNYDKVISNSKENGVFIDDVLEMLAKPVEMDKRFEGTTGIK